MTEFPPLERDVKADCIALWEAAGCKVWDTSSRRESPIRPAGFADLVVFMPRGGGVVFHEVKRPKGKQSDGQILFQATCLASNVVCIVGGLDEARAALTLAGILE